MLLQCAIIAYQPKCSTQDNQLDSRQNLIPLDAEQNKESAKDKITMPVLVLGGDIYPALGGDFPGNFALSSTQALAENVTGVTVPLSGHWIPEEQPQFVIERW